MAQDSYAHQAMENSLLQELVKSLLQEQDESNSDQLQNHIAMSDQHRRALVEWYIEYDFDSPEEKEWFYLFNCLGTVVMIFCVSVVSALFLGLLTLDAMDLRIIQRSSLDEDERKYAAALYPIVKERHLLLVTLLIVNALAYEGLPLFLDKLVPSWMTILLSTTLVLLFGEIIPSAIFTGPNQLALGFRMVPLVKFLLVVVYPLAKPCSVLLDAIVFGPDGFDPTAEEYNRGDLSALVNIQYEQRFKQPRKTAAEQKFFLFRSSNNNNNNKYPPSAVSEQAKHEALLSSFDNNDNTNSWGAMKQEMLEAVNERRSELDCEEEYADHEGPPPTMEEALKPPMEKQEVDLVVGALQLKTKVAIDVYTPLRHVYAVPDDLVLDKQSVAKIYAQGYSRVPVYRRRKDDEDDRSCVLGFLMTRQLMLIDWEHEREVSTLPLVRPDAVSPRRNLVSLLKLLRTGGSHMAMVCARPDLANRALSQPEVTPLSVEAGFMGIVTLEDILESILQTRIYDEVDIRDRDRAVMTLTRWAAEKLQSFARKAKQKRRSSSGSGSPQKHTIFATSTTTPTSSTITAAPNNEQTPLLGMSLLPLYDDHHEADTAGAYTHNI